MFIMKSIFKIEIFTLIIFFIFSLYGYAHIYKSLYINEYSFNELSCFSKHASK